MYNTARQTCSPLLQAVPNLRHPIRYPCTRLRTPVSVVSNLGVLRPSLASFFFLLVLLQLFRFCSRSAYTRPDSVSIISTYNLRHKRSDPRPQLSDPRHTPRQSEPVPAGGLGTDRGGWRGLSAAWVDSVEMDG